MKIDRKWVIAGAVIALFAVLVAIIVYEREDYFTRPLVCSQEAPAVKYAHPCTPEDLTKFRSAMKRISNELAPTFPPPVSAGLASFIADQHRFSKTILKARLDRNELPAACHEILRFNKTGGVYDPRKDARRKKEFELCMTKG